MASSIILSSIRGVLPLQHLSSQLSTLQGSSEISPLPSWVPFPATTSVYISYSAVSIMHLLWLLWLLNS